MKATPIPAKVREKKLAQCPFCAVCGTTADLELNHIDPAKPATFDNLIVLCSTHHGLWHDMSARHRHTDLLRMGIQEAKERGVKFGKKPLNIEPVMKLIAEHSTSFNPASMMAENEIRDIAGVGTTTYYKAKKMLIRAIRQNEWPYEWPKPEYYGTPMYEHSIRRKRGETV